MDHPQGERAITTTRAQYWFVGANDYKYSRDQWLSVPSEAQRSSRYKIYGHPSDERPMLLISGVSAINPLVAIYNVYAYHLSRHLSR
jgi:hypothetical protein